MTLLRLGTVTFAVLAAACASTGQRPGDTGGGGDENRITHAELQAAPAGTLADYVRAHRPRWLERNYSAVFNDNRVQTVVVFMDNQMFGGPETLATLTTRSAYELRYYTPSEAQAQFGPGYINGVIQIITRGG